MAATWGSANTEPSASTIDEPIARTVASPSAAPWFGVLCLGPVSGPTAGS